MQQQLIDQNIFLTKQLASLKNNTKEVSDKKKPQAYIKKTGNNQEQPKNCVIIDRLDNGDYIFKGNTYNVKEVLKNMGGRWAQEQKAWTISNPTELEVVKTNLTDAGCKIVVQCADWKN